ncbi:phage portal protein [Escherichia coli]|nr:phage portal protein [Escherichia coli]EFC4478947.1 phage portal protein [Escherichia coli]EFH2778000.1 phage portal protein [Escherichia coli]EFN7346893.1 phage portal protein [Escherichia coli]EHB7611266.1 phage portal protein [Escherichia coli]
MFFSGLFQRKSDAPVTTPAELADAIGLSYDTYTGKQISSQRAMRLTAVFSCVRVLAESVGMLPCNLYHLNGSLKQRATGERLHKLISTHPNGYMTPQEFWELVVTCLCLRGNFYAYKVKAFGEVAELLPVDPGCVVTEMNDTSGRWSYARQLYGHVYTAKIGTLSELVTAGDQFNQQHITLAGYEKETQTPADELAASRTARAAVFIRNDPARPTQTGELVGMLPAPKGKRFTMTEQQTLLSHGVATAYVESGVLRIQRDVTTYRKNAYGVADNSYLDSETLHTSAYVLRKLKSVITSKYGRHKLASDGTRFGPGQAIVTPAVIKGELLATYRQLERAGIVENYELFKQYLVVERDASDPNRLNTLFPPDYVNQLRVFAVVNQFRLQYSEESA